MYIHQEMVAAKNHLFTGREVGPEESRESMRLEGFVEEEVLNREQSSEGVMDMMRAVN